MFDNDTKECHTGGSPFICPAGGLGKAIFENMKKHAAAGLIAQIEGETGLEESFEVALSKCIKIALFLKQQGIQPGDVISMCSENTLNTSAVLFASLFTGVILAATDPRFSADYTKNMLDMVEPKLVFVCEQSIDLITNATNGSNYATKIVPLYDHDLMENVPCILDRYSIEDIQDFQPIYVKDLTTTASMLFSSGSTGLPKASCLSHNSLVTDFGLNYSLFTKYNLQRIRILGYASLFWISGFNYIVTCYYFGFTKVLLRKYVAETVWDNLQKYEVNLFFLSHVHGPCIQYLQHSLPHLKAIAILSGTLPSVYHNLLKQKMPSIPIMTGYGMTEIGVVAVNNGSYEPPNVFSLCPKGSVIKIVNPENETSMDLNQIGEIRIKGANQLIGYYKMDSKDCWDAQGFFKTGDLGYLDDNYRLHIVDRIKEMIKVDSYRIATAPIEKVLKEHPAVLFPIVVGLCAVGERDERALGVVVLKDGFSASADELLQFANDKLDDLHKIRAGIQFIAETDVPYTVTGKIHRIKVRQMFKHLV